MVYGCAFWPIKDETEIASYGFDDSKALTELKREKLFHQLATCGKIGWLTYSITAREISSDMLRRIPISLNAISHDAAITMLELILQAGVRIEKVYVDTVGDPGTYQAKLQRIFNGGRQTSRGWPIDFTVSKKADSLYKTVSAASIAAKVTRDKSIRYWKFEEPALQSIVPPTDEELDQYTCGTSLSSSSKSKKSTKTTSKKSAKAITPLVEETSTAKPDDDFNDDENMDDDEDIGIDINSSENDDEDEEDDIVVNNRRSKTSVVDQLHTESSTAATTSLTSSTSTETATNRFSSALSNSSIHPAISGSGYPSDPLTKRWLQDTFDPVFGWTSITRFSWRPALNMIEEQGVPVDWGIEDEDNKNKQQPVVNKAQQAKFLSFFTAAASTTTPSVTQKGRSAWLRKR